MITPRRITAVIAALALLATPGCAIGFNSGTSQVRGSLNGVDATLPTGLGVRGAAIVAGATTSTIVGALKNSSDKVDALVGVEFGGGITGTLTPTAIEVQPGAITTLGLPSSQARVDVGVTPSKPSQYVDVTFIFRESGRLNTQLLVVEPVREYKDIQVK